MRVYGSGATTIANVTDAQIRALRDRIAADPDWAGGGGTRARMLRSCELALYSRIYQGALAAIVNVLNEEAAK